jgi:hypothetical protein
MSHDRRLAGKAADLGIWPAEMAGSARSRLHVVSRTSDQGFGTRRASVV